MSELLLIHLVFAYAAIFTIRGWSRWVDAHPTTGRKRLALVGLATVVSVALEWAHPWRMPWRVLTLAAATQFVYDLIREELTVHMNPSGRIR